jgi:flagellar protein FlaI
LNAVSLFIPPVAKVVSIEDTREITLYHDNWIASVTREALTRKVERHQHVRPAEGSDAATSRVHPCGGSPWCEAQTLFQAMNTGHTTFSTMHAGSVDAAIHRLESEPLNVPRNMVQALNIISVQGLIYHGTERVRRVQEIVEIAGIDPSTGNLRVNNVFVYDPVHDVSVLPADRRYIQISLRSGDGPGNSWKTRLRSGKIHSQEMKKQGIMDYISVAPSSTHISIDAKMCFPSIDDLRKVIR